MKHYKKPDLSLWAFELDGSQDHLITEDMIPITEDELTVLQYVPPTLPPPGQFSSLAYLDLFTETEQLQVVTATMQSAQVKLWYDKMLAAEYITLADVRTEQGLAVLVSLSLLTPERKAQIITAMQ